VREPAATVASKPNQVEHPPGPIPGNSDEVACRDTYLACFKCCRRSRVQDVLNGRRLHKTYLKAASEAQTATKQAIRDWKQNLDRKASSELSGRGTAALQDAMEAQVRLELSA
jgi:hypothetical protein